MRDTAEPTSDTSPRTPRSPQVRHVLNRVRNVFDRLDSYSCLSSRDIQEFAYYQDLYQDALLALDEKIVNGVLEPVNLEGFPQVLSFPGYRIDVALFIGSFDPFQMTHLAAALRYLAAPEISTPVVFVIPEGHLNPDKPGRSEYKYRFAMLTRQLQNIFYPFIYPLDIGEGADTIEIVRRFISQFPGAHICMTHLVGSDVLPVALKWLPKDMEVWEAEARSKGITFSYDAFVIQRGRELGWLEEVRKGRESGVVIRYDERSISMPSSTDFRSNQAFSIVFPTEAVMRHVEVLFRYGLNKPWTPPSSQGSPPDSLPVDIFWDTDY